MQEHWPYLLLQTAQDPYKSLPGLQWGLHKQNTGPHTPTCVFNPLLESGLITSVLGRYGWTGSYWWRWKRLIWASARAASWRISSHAAPVALILSSASRSSYLPAAWTGSESGTNANNVVEACLARPSSFHSHMELCYRKLYKLTVWEINTKQQAERFKYWTKGSSHLIWLFLKC